MVNEAHESSRTGTPQSATPTTAPAAGSPAHRADGVGPSPLAGTGDGAAIDPAQEQELWVGRTHWKHYAGRIGLWLLGNAAVAVLLAWAASRVDWLRGTHAFWTVVVLVAVSGAVVLGRVAIRIIGVRYRVTSQRLFIEQGILSQTIDQTELIRVDDVRVYKSFLDRLFGLGTIAVVSTDATDRETVIEGVPAPESVAEAIRVNMRAMRRKSLFVENL